MVGNTVLRRRRGSSVCSGGRGPSCGGFRTAPSTRRWCGREGVWEKDEESWPRLSLTSSTGQPGGEDTVDVLLSVLGCVI